MPYKRVHSNGFELVINPDPSRRDCWFVKAIEAGPNGKRSTLLGLETSSLARAKEVGDRVALVSHQCTDKCEDWKAVFV